MFPCLPHRSQPWRRCGRWRFRPLHDNVVAEMLEGLLVLVDSQLRSGAGEPERDVAALPAVPVAVPATDPVLV